MKKCQNCRKELQLKGKVGRTEECPYCRADLHCCRNCRFFDPRSPKQCREPVAELVREKAKANYCDFFSFAEAHADGNESSIEKARREFEALFNGQGKKSAE